MPHLVWALSSLDKAHGNVRKLALQKQGDSGRWENVLVLGLLVDLHDVDPQIHILGERGQNTLL